MLSGNEIWVSEGVISYIVTAPRIVTLHVIHGNCWWIYNMAKHSIEDKLNPQISLGDILLLSIYLFRLMQMGWLWTEKGEIFFKSNPFCTEYLFGNTKYICIFYHRRQIESMNIITGWYSAVISSGLCKLVDYEPKKRDVFKLHPFR